MKILAVALVLGLLGCKAGSESSSVKDDQNPIQPAQPAVIDPIDNVLGAFSGTDGSEEKKAAKLVVTRQGGDVIFAAKREPGVDRKWVIAATKLQAVLKSGKVNLEASGFGFFSTLWTIQLSYSPDLQNILRMEVIQTDRGITGSTPILLVNSQDMIKQAPPGGVPVVEPGPGGGAGAACGSTEMPLCGSGLHCVFVGADDAPGSCQLTCVDSRVAGQCSPPEQFTHDGCSGANYMQRCAAPADGVGAACGSTQMPPCGSGLHCVFVGADDAPGHCSK